MKLLKHWDHNNWLSSKKYIDIFSHIAAKLNLQPGQRVLDIGCGWGSLALYLASHYDVEVTGNRYYQSSRQG